MSAEEWDTRYYSIFNDLVWEQGMREDESAHAVAVRECTEQFGERPNDEEQA